MVQFTRCKFNQLCPLNFVSFFFVKLINLGINRNISPQIIPDSLHLNRLIISFSPIKNDYLYIVFFR